MSEKPTVKQSLRIADGIKDTPLETVSEYERGRRDGLLLGRLAAIDAIQSRMVLSADQYKTWRAYRTEIEQRLTSLDAPAFLSGLGEETAAEFDAKELAATSGTPAPNGSTGWLIEREGAEWFTGRTWTHDSTKAIRFFSYEDAQWTIDLIKFDPAKGIKPTEHIWS